MRSKRRGRRRCSDSGTQKVKSDLVDVVERNIQISNCCDPDDLRSTWPGAVHSKNQYRLRRPQAVYLHTTKYFVRSIHEALWLTH